MRLALYEPDIPQNTGTILRLAACLDVAVDVIGPTGFDMSDRALRRAGARLPRPRGDRAPPELCRVRWRRAGRVARGSCSSPRARGYGLHGFCVCRRRLRCCSGARVPVCRRPCTGLPTPAVRIPMASGLRSLNVAVAAAMVLGEALRQTGGFRARPPSP